MDVVLHIQQYLRLCYEFMGYLYARTHRLPLPRFALLILTVLTTAFFATLPQSTLANDTTETWWSLRPLANPPPPQFRNAPVDWDVNPIDSFILRKLRDADLEPSPPTDRVTLIPASRSTSPAFLPHSHRSPPSLKIPPISKPPTGELSIASCLRPTTASVGHSTGWM